MTPHSFLSAVLALSACSGKDATDVAPADADADVFDETVDCNDGDPSNHYLVNPTPTFA